MNGPVLVTGAAGQLGSTIVRTFADTTVQATTRAELDIADPEAVRRVVEIVCPAVIVNCAAMNKVDDAEDAPEAALSVNALALRGLARAAEMCDATLVHYSTDFVFDGEASEPYDEQAATSPQSVYAASKLLGEWFALDAPKAFVLRVESLFGCAPEWAGPRGTLDSLVRGIREGRELKVFRDRVVSPSYLHDVAAATRHLVESGAAPGLYHCVNAGHATWEQVAEEAARLLGVPARLQPVTMAEMNLRARRPRFCVLSNRKLAAAGFAMPAWQDALHRWLAGAAASGDGGEHAERAAVVNGQ
jgi:dTDP-4-dehydrorhamnose reductase